MKKSRYADASTKTGQTGKKPNTVNEEGLHNNGNQILVQFITLNNTGIIPLNVAKWEPLNFQKCTEETRYFIRYSSRTVEKCYPLVFNKIIEQFGKSNLAKHKILSWVRDHTGVEKKKIQNDLSFSPTSWRDQLSVRVGSNIPSRYKHTYFSSLLLNGYYQAIHNNQLQLSCKIFESTYSIQNRELIDQIINKACRITLSIAASAHNQWSLK